MTASSVIKARPASIKSNSNSRKYKGRGYFTLQLMMPSHRTFTQPRKPWYFDLIDRTARPRYDVSPLFATPDAMHSLLNDVSAHFENAKPEVTYDKIAGLDALGFVLGGALATKLHKPFIPVRKGGKLPFTQDLLEQIEFKDYDEKTKQFELLRGWLKEGMSLRQIDRFYISANRAAGDRVLLVDEWVGTGAQMLAAIELIERMGATVAGIACIYLHPDFPQNIEMAKKYETFTANCLLCTYFECRCASDGATKIEN